MAASEQDARGGGKGCTASAWLGLGVVVAMALFHLANVLMQQQTMHVNSALMNVPGSGPLATLGASSVVSDGGGGAGPLPRERKDLADWVSGVATLQEIEALQELRLWLEKSRGNVVEVTHAVEKSATGFGWTTCSMEGELCNCPGGHVRYGDPDAQRWVESTTWMEGKACVTSEFGGRDVAPGKVKTCQCMAQAATCEDGSPVDWSLCPGSGLLACRAGCDRSARLSAKLPGRPAAKRQDLCTGNRAFELLWSCDRSGSRVPRPGHAHNEAQEVLDHSVEKLCDDPSLTDQFNTYLDCEFLDSYLEWTSDDSEWLEEAYVTYVAGPKDSKYEWQATNLVRSISLFSTRPVVVMVFGANFVPPLQWRELPNVIVYRMLPIKSLVSFNFNKIRAMVGVRAVSGIQLDTDQIIFNGMDQVFNSTLREITSRYPWPMMPVHWMSRDVHKGNPYPTYAFTLYKEKHTMRWNHAHPTWSYFALPFLCDLLLERYIARTGGGFQAWRLQDASSVGLLALLRGGENSQAARSVAYRGWMIEDEDMLNVNMWRDGANKAWCKFDLEPSLFLQRFGLDKKMYADPMWYPDGVPLLFISSHNTKNFEATDWLLALLARCSKTPKHLRCPARGQADPEICKAGSIKEREARQSPSEYASEACCCVEPRWSKPVFWHGQWYSSMQEVPMVSPSSGSSGMPRRCVMP